MTGREQAGARPGPAGSVGAAGQARATRIVLAALLMALVLAGLRGHIRLHDQAGPYQGDGIVVGVMLEAVLAALLIRGRRAPAEAVLAARLRIVLRPVLITGLIVIPLTLLVAAPLRTHPRLQRLPGGSRPTLRPRLPSARPAPHGSVAIHIPLSGVLYALLIIALITGTAACAVLLRRRQASAAAAASYPEVVPDADAQRAGLRDAVESGSSALRAFGEARAAIIACYLSMEQSLGRAGAVRDAADTPDELLARAARAGLVRGSAAARLTGLFYEARFSSHQLGTEQRDAAREALRELADDLVQPQAGTGD